MSNKRGRPKSDRPRVDYGTPESIKRRITISPADPTQATNPLDAIKSRGYISDEAYAAACYFAAIRKQVFGKAIPPAMDMGSITGKPNELDDERMKHHMLEYRDACNAMMSIGRISFDAVDNLVVHERWPLWITDPMGRTVVQRQRFMLGIAALLGWHKNKDRRVA